MKFPSWIKVFGDTSYRNKKCPSEGAEQITFFNYIRKLEPTAVHIKNEGKRTYHQVSAEKAQGMTPGAPDIIIPGSPTFVCELKKADHTLCRWQDAQQPYLKAAQENGAFVCVALGHKGATEAYKEWKSLNKQTEN